jgi:uncharacterized protein YbaP (TraB family)
MRDHSRGRRHALLASLLFTGLVVCRLAAQSSAPQPAKKALFWKVSSAGNVIYLLGSIHFGSKNMYPLPGEIETAFERSTALIVEIDLNHVDMLKTQALVMQSGLYPAGETLWDHVSPETRQLLEQFCTTYGLPAERLAMMKPWLVAVTTSVLPMLKSGMAPDLGIDKYFLDKAKDRRVVEIESAEWQLKLLSGFAESVQEKYLASAIKDAGETVDDVRRIQDSWIAGDVAQLEKRLAESSGGPPEVMKAMLQDRNPHMADVAEQFLKGKDVGFLVVGAAHLIGKDGVVAILEKRGYKVEQVALKK